MPKSNITAKMVQIERSTYIAECLRDEIEVQYDSGSKYKSIRQTMVKFDCNYNTARGAYVILKEQGIITMGPKGTFVK